MTENSDMDSTLSHTPAWSSWLGIIMIVLGVYLTAAHGNQVLVHAVLDGEASIEIEGYVHDCPRDELMEEGITIAMCKQATYNADSMLLSRPAWFREAQIGLMSIGTVLAFASIFIAVGLMEYRPWAPAAALFVLAGLLLVDIIGFMTVVFSGPLIRQMYLWQIMLWFFIHSTLLAAVVAGIAEDKAVAKDATA